MAAKHSARFQPGQSGNPAGRPKGSRNQATIMFEALCESGRLDEVYASLFDNAAKGREASQRLVITRMVPAARRRTVTLDLPRAETPDEIVAAHGVVVEALGRGEISPDEAVEIAHVLDSQRRAIDSAELERRVVELEEAVGIGAAAAP